jgi:hypothetical protein
MENGKWKMENVKTGAGESSRLGFICPFSIFHGSTSLTTGFPFSMHRPEGTM